MPDIIKPYHKVIPWYPRLIRTHSELIRRESSFTENASHSSTVSQKDLDPRGRKNASAPG